VLRCDSQLQSDRSRQQPACPQYQDGLGLGSVAPAMATLAGFLPPDYTRLRLQRLGSWLRSFK